MYILPKTEPRKVGRYLCKKLPWVGYMERKRTTKDTYLCRREMCVCVCVWYEKSIIGIHHWSWVMGHGSCMGHDQDSQVSFLSPSPLII